MPGLVHANPNGAGAPPRFRSLLDRVFAQEFAAIAVAGEARIDEGEDRRQRRQQHPKRNGTRNAGPELPRVDPVDRKTTPRPGSARCNNRRAQPVPIEQADQNCDAERAGSNAAEEPI